MAKPDATEIILAELRTLRQEVRTEIAGLRSDVSQLSQKVAVLDAGTIKVSAIAATIVSILVSALATLIARFVWHTDLR